MMRLHTILTFCVLFIQLDVVAQQTIKTYTPKNLKQENWLEQTIKANTKSKIVFNYNSQPLDLSTYKNLGVTFDNKNKYPLDVTVFVRGKEKYKEQYCRYIIPAKDTLLTKVILPRPNLSKENDWKKTLGSTFVLPYDMHPKWSAFDLKNTLRVEVVINNKYDHPMKVRLKQPQGVGEFEFHQHPTFDLPIPTVDKMGQLKSENWEGKVQSISELKKQGNKDQKQYTQSEFSNIEYDQFGGWKNGPQLEATGQFYTKKYKGKWHLVDPLGHLFFSLGVTGVGQGSGTPTKNREQLFSLDHAIEDVYSDKKGFINYYDRNLVYKYGKEWKNIHHEVTVGRLQSWNLNTCGAWSNVIPKQKVPYTLIIHPKLTHFGKVDKVPDPFDPDFENGLRSRIQGVISRGHKGDAWNLGIFVNNEIHWGNDSYALALGVLNEKLEIPARKEMSKFLEGKYSTIKKLNQQWNSSFNDFDNIQVQKVNDLNEVFKEDMKAYTQHHAEVYYKLCAEVIHEMLPGHLYLGSRIHGKVMEKNEAIQLAAAKYCDVVSFNIYRYDVSDFKPLYLVDKPIIIGEFHFGFSSHGVWGDGLKYATSEKHQADLYKAYMKGVIEHPNLVGAHWFQWSDQPVLGRKDGENYRIGLVDVTDQEFTHLTDAIKEVSSWIYENQFE
ncbi:beta-galactosidase [Flammeovirga agarivorans]|uniref:Beta-agarase n=1 Tax=Flammeovirga agarivorans TaxID=2726742 RepID=A0A7X8SKU4_9BACT|nr:beta-galactosidase [Flammeovirga agarivorans]NLR91972.1 hypothetical protein [Flammeovirga agarivorans]